MNKISIIGAGNVGSQTAFCLAQKGFADIVLIDIIADLARGKALDIAHSLPIYNSNINVIGTDDYRSTKNSDIVIMTAGLPRQLGMTRDDLLQKNATIIKLIVPKILQHSPKCNLIVVTNPLDAISYYAYKISGLPKSKVIGMAGMLDTTRLKYYISTKVKADYNLIEAIVLGCHGDQMVGLENECTINNKKISDLVNEDDIKEIFSKTSNAGAEVVQYLKQGSAYFAAGASITVLAESILLNQKKVIPCSALLRGEYGHHDVFAGVPVILGKNGIEKIIELNLIPSKKKAFDQAISHTRKLTEKLLN